MKTKTLPLFILLLFSFYLFPGCNNKQKPAIGKEDEIIVIADSTLYYQIEPEMLHVFEKIIYTPQPENLFNLKRENLKNLNKLKNRKNIIIVGTLDSDDAVSEYIKASLDSSVTKLVKERKNFFFNKNDLWAKHQLVMFLTANSIDELKQNILNANEELLYSFRQTSNKRLFAKLYKPGLEMKKIKARLLKSYGWTFYIQPGTELAINDSLNNFVWLRSGRNTPIERWIFVHWINNANPDYLNKDSVTTIRNRITKKYFTVAEDSAYVEIATEMSKPKVSQATFNDGYSLMTQGFWKFSDKSGGGPFINYSFLDENTGRFYMVDASIFAPKYYKKKLIQQADVILNSFKTKDKLSKKRIEEILSELD